MNTVVNIAVYQAVWFLCIRFGNPGAVISLPLLALHLIFSDRRKADLKIMGLLLLAGLIIDGSLNAAGFYTFSPPAVPIPFWLVVIWLGLATLIHHSLSWLKTRPILCALFGALGGPMAYWAGVEMGAAAFNWGLLPSLFILAVVWASFWPGVIYLAARDSFFVTLKE